MTVRDHRAAVRALPLSRGAVAAAVAVLCACSGGGSAAAPPDTGEISDAPTLEFAGDSGEMADPAADTSDLPQADGETTDDPNSHDALADGDTGETEDVRPCLFDSDCGTVQRSCDGGVVRETVPRCVSGSCARDTTETACETAPPRCENGVVWSEAPACRGTLCTTVAQQTPCADTETCGGDACVPIESYPAEIAFRGLLPDGLDAEDAAAAGVGRVRIEVRWDQWQPSLASPPCAAGWEEFDGVCFVRETETDAEIRAYSSFGVGVVAHLVGTPAWARDGRSGCPNWASEESANRCAPDDPTDFARFARFLAHRYRAPAGETYGRIDDWIVWDEANLDDRFSLGGWPNEGNATDRQSAYAALYWAASEAIRSLQPTARVYVSITNLLDDSASGVHFSGWRTLEAVSSTAEGRPWHVTVAPWSVAPGLLGFSWLDWPRLTFGTLPVLIGWLHAISPEAPPTVLLAGAGFTSIGDDGENAQADAICRAYAQARATPGVTGWLYQRWRDREDEASRSLLLGLADVFGNPKASWATWVEMDAPGSLRCGFETGSGVLLRRWRGGGTVWVTPRDPGDGEFAADPGGWRLAREAGPGLHAVYDCMVLGTNDHFLSLEPSCEGAAALGPVGYAWDAEAPARALLYRCFSPSTGHHDASDDVGCGAGDMEFSLGFVYVVPG